MLVVVEDTARRTRCSPILSWPCRAHQNVESTASGPVPSPVLDGRHALSRRGPSAGHGGQRRPLWYHQTALVVATDAPPIRREAWATLQEWAVCSSIFVVGQGVKAGLPGSTPRGTLNARSKRVARSRRPGGRRIAYIAPRSAPPRSLCRRATALCPAVAALTHLWRKRRRQHRAAEGLVAPRDSVDASAALRALGGAACSSMQFAEQWARCWHAAMRAGSHAFHL